MFDGDARGGDDHDTATPSPGTAAPGPAAPGTGAHGAGAQGGFGVRVAGLGEALVGLLGVEPGGLSDGELADAMVGLRREQARLAAVVAELTAAFDARQVHAADGARSAVDWIAVRARLPRG